MTSTPALEATDLVKSFRRAHQPPLRAVDRLSLTVPTGQVMALLGPNGAGKSTTIDMLLGLARPDSGTIRVSGRDPRTAATSGKVGAVLQGQGKGLLGDLTVCETVRAIAATHHRRDRVAPVMARWGLDEFASRKVGKCSGGQQQRLLFALALLPEPDLLILDEPTSGLDVEARRQFWEEMEQEAAAGRTIIFATHYVEEAERFAQRVVLVAAGRVVADGTVAQVRSRVSGSTVSAVLPGEATLDPAELPGHSSVTRQGERTVISTDRPDDVARHLLTRTPAHHLLVSTTTLEDAFVQLTHDHEEDAA